MLKDETIDVVHILTPNNAHCEITVAALDAGKNVMCEKPMAATTKEAQMMLDARDRSGKLLTIGYQYRHFPVNALMKKVVNDGLIGEPYYIEANYLRRGVPTWGVFIDKSKQGGAIFVNWCIPHQDKNYTENAKVYSCRVDDKLLGKSADIFKKNSFQKIVFKNDSEFSNIFNELLILEKKYDKICELEVNALLIKLFIKILKENKNTTTVHQENKNFLIYKKI